jgi:hypothetical protein
MELKPRGGQRWSTIIGKGTARGATIAAHHLGLGGGAPFQWPCERPHPPHAFFQRFLGRAIGLIEGLGGFTPIMAMTQRVRHTRQGLRHSGTAGGLAVADAPNKRHLERLLHLLNEVRQLLVGG